MYELFLEDYAIERMYGKNIRDEQEEDEYV